MFTKLSLAALIAAVVALSAPVLATQKNADAIVTSPVDNVTARGGAQAPGSTLTSGASKTELTVKRCRRCPLGRKMQTLQTLPRVATDAALHLACVMLDGACGAVQLHSVGKSAETRKDISGFR